MKTQAERLFKRPVTLTKPSEVLRHILDTSGIYSAWTGSYDGYEFMCHAVDHTCSMWATPELAEVTEAKIRESIGGLYTLANFLDSGAEGPSRYSEYFRAKAIAHWRDLIMRLEEDGE